jgi:hypothetical protein
MTDTPEQHRVGYGRPPIQSRFRKGRSGNPRGRPRGAKNLATDLAEELAERIPIREGERRLRVSKQRALLKAIVAKALKGDTRASAVILRLVASVLGPSDRAQEHMATELADEDLAILERFVERRLRGPNRESDDE